MSDPVRLDELTPAQRRLVLALIDAFREHPPAPVPFFPMLSIEEAAEALGIGRTLVYAEISAGRLRSHKVGRRRIVSVQDIEDYIAGRV